MTNILGTYWLLKKKKILAWLGMYILQNIELKFTSSTLLIANFAREALH